MFRRGGAAAVIFLAFLLMHGCASGPRPRSGAAVSSVPRAAGFMATINRGQTLERLARSYRVDMGELLRANPGLHPSRLEPGQQVWIPTAAKAARLALPYPSSRAAEIKGLVGPKNYFSTWKTITVHHSGTTQGNAILFDRDHRRRKMGGLFYHFVIGNGTSTEDGELEVGFRWKKQVKANRPYDIQICLVGNFDDQNVSDEQFKALVTLIRILREQYDIPDSNVRRHNEIHGKATDCPGTRFPFKRLLSEIGNGSR